MSRIGVNEITIGLLRNTLESLPRTMDDMPVKFVMEYSFKSWIESMENGQSFGGLFVMLAARKLLKHMKEHSRWRADFQTAKVILRKDGVPELRFGNTADPVSLWWEREIQELRINIAELSAGQGIVKRKIT